MRTYRFLPAAMALFGLGILLFRARGQSSGGAASAPGGTRAAPGKAVENPASAALTLGGKVFVERCAKCHGDDGTKPLDGGPALSERKLSDEQLAKNVHGRLSGAPEEQQRAVAAYIRSFQKK